MYYYIAQNVHDILENIKLHGGSTTCELEAYKLVEYILCTLNFTNFLQTRKLDLFTGYVLLSTGLLCKRILT